MNVSNGKLWRTKELLRELSGEGNIAKKNNTPSLFASYIRCLSFKLLPRVFVRVCGKGVATHTELVVHKHTMRDTAAQKRERERLSKHYYYTNYR